MRRKQPTITDTRRVFLQKAVTGIGSFLLGNLTGSKEEYETIEGKLLSGIEFTHHSKAGKRITPYATLQLLVEVDGEERVLVYQGNKEEAEMITALKTQENYRFKTFKRGYLIEPPERI